MPNHVKTVIKFKNLKPENIREIVNKITTKDSKDDILGYYIDFDKIIPEPRIKDECPAGCIATDKSHIEADSDRPWFDWYAWHVAYWGTKWNAYSCYTQIKTNSILFIFSTAWSPALPVFTKLADLGYDMEIRYADEDLGYNCGLYKYTASEHDWEVNDERDMKDSRTFAKRIWDKY